MSAKKELWKILPIGGLIVKPGSSEEYKTGSWRTYKPIKKDNCIDCLTCYIYCPDVAIIVQNDKMIGFNYDYCKGCGICRSVCPVKEKAIEMILDEK